MSKSTMILTQIQGNYYFGDADGVVTNAKRTTLTRDIHDHTIKRYFRAKNMGELIQINTSANIPVISRNLNKQEQIRFDAIAATFALAQDIAPAVNENKVFNDMTAE